jgi:MFS family permease
MLSLCCRYDTNFTHVVAAGGMTMANSIGTLIPTFLEYYSQDGTAPVSTAKVTELATYPSLFMGVGAIISVILAQWIGTRPVLIIDAIITLCFTIWAIFTDGSERGLSQHIAARAMASLGVGAVESLVPVILKDTNYLHTRNMRLSFVWSVGGIFNAALASSSTYIIEGRDWRVFYWILVGIMAAALVLIILVVPESSWQRTHEDYGPWYTIKRLLPMNITDSFIYSRYIKNRRRRVRCPT